MPPHAAAMAMTTLVATAMVGAQTTINNQQSTKSSNGNGEGNVNDDRLGLILGGSLWDKCLSFWY
jgi:hypothetical protein